MVLLPVSRAILLVLLLAEPMLLLLLLSSLIISSSVPPKGLSQGIEDMQINSHEESLITAAQAQSCKYDVRFSSAPKQILSYGNHR